MFHTRSAAAQLADNRNHGEVPPAASSPSPEPQQPIAWDFFAADSADEDTSRKSKKRSARGQDLAKSLEVENHERQLLSLQGEVGGRESRLSPETIGEAPATETFSEPRVESPPREISEAEAAASKATDPHRIHILGTNATAKFFAHSLAGITERPPITLLLHTQDLENQWRREGEVIDVIHKGESAVRGGFDTERTNPLPLDKTRLDKTRDKTGLHTTLRPVPLPQFSEPMIHNLIVTTKADATVSALSSLKHRLGRSSTICFIQDAMGVIDAVNTYVFRSPSMRPNYIQAVSTHVLYEDEREFTILDAGYGQCYASLMERSERSYIMANDEDRSYYVPSDLGVDASPGFKIERNSWPIAARYLMRTLARTPILNITAISNEEMLLRQAERLAVDAALGPLSVMFDTPNSGLMSNFYVTKTMRQLLTETCTVLRALPELSRAVDVEWTLEPKRLENILLGILRRTGDNLSKMLQDVRSGQRTEIRYLNGYIVRRATEMNMEAPHNSMAMNIVEAKRKMVKLTQDSYIPFDGGRREED